MRAWIVGGSVAAAVAVGGVAFVLAGGGSGHHCGPCVKTEVGVPAEAPAKVTVETCEPGATVCPRCKPTPPGEVVDVADLRTGYDPLPTTFISFDEPPLAKPKAGVVIPSKYEQPTAREVLPPPVPVE